MTSRPDIIMLVLDTQRADLLSCYGYPLQTSPYLDAFAADATFFRFAVSPAQWTVPSHTSMFTGLYPSRHQTLHASSVIPDSLPTLAERLSDSGYYTSAFCNNPLVGVVNNGLRRGFLDFFNYSGLMTSRPNRAGTRTNLFDRYRQFFKRTLSNALSTMQDIFARSDTLLDFSFSPIMVPLWQTALSFKGNTAKSLNDAARLHVERKGVAEDQPIFSFINLMGTHMPYHPPHRFVQQFAPHVLQDKTAKRYLRRFNGDVFGWLAPLATSIDEKSRRTLESMYIAEVAYQDELVGTFINRLRASGRLDSTLLMVVADHGEHLGEKMFIGHSITLYNELIHVPLIIRDPRNDLKRATEVTSFMSTRRIFHTALEAAGIGSTAENALSLARNGDDDPERDVVFSEGVPPSNMLNLLQRRAPELTAERGCDKVRRAVYSGHYKLIKTGESKFELYDILDDPHEETNLCDILPEQVELMQEQLEAFLQQNTLAPAKAEERSDQNDPEVNRRLHDLGYLE